MPERLDGVLRVLYLIFNEGYDTSSGDALIRRELCTEAVRLGRVLATLMPDEPEVLGLLALMLLTDARREARVTDTGELVLLDGQDRSRWDAAEIAEGSRLVDQAYGPRAPGRTSSRRPSPRSTTPPPSADATTGRRSWPCTTRCSRPPPPQWSS